MMKNWIMAVMLLFNVAAFGQKEELRGAWIATYTNIDYPVRGQSPVQQQEHFVRIIDTLAKSGFNAVYVQVRSQADAMYPSAYEPWSADLTGVQGKSPEPFWDPLQFMITETHKRGMEFHAWINPYRVSGNSGNLNGAASGHISRTEPGWLLRFGSLITLDPGLPAVRDYIKKIVSDITRRYDVDGIHFDDYFYPDPAVNDHRTFATHKRGFNDKSSWRRDNVDLLIKDVSSEIKSIKPWVKFGVSPSGIYRNSKDFSVGTPTTGLEHYTYLYSDTKKWLAEGWIDYLEPQVYWSARQPGARFGDIVPWWNSIAGERHMYIGLAAYKVERGGPYGWSDPSELPTQVRYTRQNALPGIKGHAIYNTSSILGNALGLFDSLKLLYSKPAIVPEMRWIDSEKPQGPSRLNAVRIDGKVTLTWELPVTRSAKDAPRNILVYRSEAPVINQDDPSQLLAVLPYTNVYSASDSGSGYYAVSIADRTSNESLLSNVVAPGKQSIPFTLVDFTLEHTDNTGIRLSWKTANESGIDRYELEKSAANGPYSVVAVIRPGYSEGLITYTFDDTIDLKGLVATYRIKVVDSTGSYTFGKPISVTAQTPPVIVSVPVTTTVAGEKKGYIFINPVRPVPAGRSISVTTAEKGDFNYSLFNDTGEKITWGKIRSVAKGTRITLPGTATLVSGKYKLAIASGAETQDLEINIL